jgi:hypothetical protein
VFTDPLFRNGLHNLFVLLLLACMLPVLPSNGCPYTLTAVYTPQYSNNMYLAVLLSRGKTCTFQQMWTLEYRSILRSTAVLFLSFLTPELCANIHNVRIANGSLSHRLYGLVCQHESRIHTEYRMQNVERTVLVISTCRQLFVPSLSFRSSNGSRCST